MLKLQLALPADGGACILLVHNHNQCWGSSHVAFGQGGRGDWEWEWGRVGGIYRGASQMFTRPFHPVASHHRSFAWPPSLVRHQSARLGARVQISCQKSPALPGF